MFCEAVSTNNNYWRHLVCGGVQPRVIILSTRIRQFAVTSCVSGASSGGGNSSVIGQWHRFKGVSVFQNLGRPSLSHSPWLYLESSLFHLYFSNVPQVLPAPFHPFILFGVPSSSLPSIQLRSLDGLYDGLRHTLFELLQGVCRGWVMRVSEDSSAASNTP